MCVCVCTCACVWGVGGWVNAMEFKQFFFSVATTDKTTIERVVGDGDSERL